MADDTAQQDETEVRSCPDCGGAITTSGGRHPARCIRAVCRYEGPGVLNERESLAAFFAAHRPIPCSIYSATEKANWYDCTCEAWSSKRTQARAEERHIREFETHMAASLVAEERHIREFETHMAASLVAAGWHLSSHGTGGQSDPG